MLRALASSAPFSFSFRTDHRSLHTVSDVLVWVFPAEVTDLLVSFCSGKERNDFWICKALLNCLTYSDPELSTYTLFILKKFKKKLKIKINHFLAFYLFTHKKNNSHHLIHWCVLIRCVFSVEHKWFILSSCFTLLYKNLIQRMMK